MTAERPLPPSGFYSHAKFMQEESINVGGRLDTFMERGVDVAGVGTGAQ
jgi:hypothetical protein